MAPLTTGMADRQEESSAAASRLRKGPYGLGDPDDTFLRKVEQEVLIPKKMRDRARNEKCVEEVKNFNDCCAGSGPLMVVKCRKENTALKSCLTRWYTNEDFKLECEKEYLAERSEYRRTGIPQKDRLNGSNKWPTSM